MCSIRAGGTLRSLDIIIVGSYDDIEAPAAEESDPAKPAETRLGDFWILVSIDLNFCDALAGASHRAVFRGDNGRRSRQ